MKKQTTKKLALTTETLRALDDNRLVAVVGGSRANSTATSCDTTNGSSTTALINPSIRPGHGY